MFKRTACLFALLLAFSFTAGTSAQTSATSLDARIKAAVADFKGQVWIHAKNLDSGVVYSLSGDQRTRTASTIKLPIMVAAFGLVADGKLKWTDELNVTEAKKVAGAGILFEFHDGLKITLRDAVHLMITISDNTATNLVIDAVTTDEVNARMDVLGFKNLRSMRKIGGGGESKAFGDASNKRADGSTYGIGMSTPQEMVALLEKLERGEIVSPEASKEMISILKRQQFHDGAGRNLKNVTIANKTGALDALRSDVGILYTPRGRIAYALTTDYIPEIDWSPDNPGLLLLSRLSELLIDGLSQPQEQSPAKKEKEEPSMADNAKTTFEITEGIFHDGLGTFAELALANKLIELAQLKQKAFDWSASEAKMRAAIARLPESQLQRRRVFEKEIANVSSGAARGAAELLEKFKPSTLMEVKHVARDFADAKAADLQLIFSDHTVLPLSVKTDKSGKLAPAGGQTSDIRAKWAERYFRISSAEFDALAGELGFASEAELKSHSLNVAQLVAQVLIRKLGLTDCTPTNFSKARVTDLAAAKFLFHQLLQFKHGSDGSQIIIFDRKTGAVKWKSLLEEVDIDGLTSQRISFRPSRPRGGNRSSVEFGIKIDDKAVVTFQVKRRRGKAKGTARQDEFSDITTRLII